MKFPSYLSIFVSRTAFTQLSALGKVALEWLKLDTLSTIVEKYPFLEKMESTQQQNRISDVIHPKHLYSAA